MPLAQPHFISADTRDLPALFRGWPPFPLPLLGPYAAVYQHNPFLEFISPPDLAAEKLAQPPLYLSYLDQMGQMGWFRQLNSKHDDPADFV